MSARGGALPPHAFGHEGARVQHGSGSCRPEGGSPDWNSATSSTEWRIELLCSGNQAGRRILRSHAGRHDDHRHVGNPSGYAGAGGNRRKATLGSHDDSSWTSSQHWYGTSGPEIFSGSPGFGREPSGSRRGHDGGRGVLDSLATSADSTNS